VKHPSEVSQEHAFRLVLWNSERQPRQSWFPDWSGRLLHCAAGRQQRRDCKPRLRRCVPPLYEIA